MCKLSRHIDRKYLSVKRVTTSGIKSFSPLKVRKCAVAELQNPEIKLAYSEFV